MKERNFQGMLEDRWSQGRRVCVGLDSDFDKIPKSVYEYDCRPTKDVVGNINGHMKYPNLQKTTVAFNCAIVEATKDSVCAFKPNIAFYEGRGAWGLLALRDTVQFINKSAPDIPVILDAKRADIGNTNTGYVQMAFEYLGVDAITVHPYLGAEALKPFLAHKDKGIIVLCRTSNPGAGEFQDMQIETDWALDGTMPLYQYVAMKVAKDWNENGNCCVVVGATFPDELQIVRQIVEDMTILIPGIGKQGGDLEKTVAAGKNSSGEGMVINSARDIIFASSGTDFAQAAGIKTEHLNQAIARCLGKEK